MFKIGVREYSLVIMTTMNQPVPDNRGLFEALVGDGRPLLLLTGLALILSGGFAIFQSATGQFLPHDVQYLGMTAQDLCRLDQCRIVHFMFHDRVSFGGALIAVGSLYLWLVEFPLKHREPWAWWLLLVSGVVGFGSFPTYIGYGYLDTWHGVATLFLLPSFIYGMYRYFFTLGRPASIGCLLRPSESVLWSSIYGIGRACLLVTAVALLIGGLTIMTVGMTTVFVPQDLQFMGMSASELHAVNPHLVPLIAHDRAGFGGGICCTGITVFFCVWCGRRSRSLWQVLCVAGLTGFGTAILIHPIVGYLSFTHLAPAVFVSMIFLLGLVLCYKPMVSGIAFPTSDQVVTPTALPVEAEEEVPQVEDRDRYEIEIEAEHWAPGQWNPPDDNTDVVVQFRDGSRFVATFFTYQNITTLRTKNQQTGECMSGGYFWAIGMILIDEASRERIQQVVEHLLHSGEFRTIFRQLSP